MYPRPAYVRALFYNYYFCYLILAPNSCFWYQKIALALFYLEKFKFLRLVMI